MSRAFPTSSTPLVLSGSLVVWRPAPLDDVAGVRHAANPDRSSYEYTTVPRDRVEVRRYVERLIGERDEGESCPFVIGDASSGEIVGMTCFLTLRWWYERGAPDALEIGGTGLSSRVQRTGVNTETKWLLLAQAFEGWAVHRADLKCDARNVRSRRAIERLGASFEGILRSWQSSQAPAESTLPRDSATYEILRSEWPALGARVSELRDRGV